MYEHYPSIHLAVCAAGSSSSHASPIGEWVYLLWDQMLMSNNSNLLMQIPSISTHNMNLSASAHFEFNDYIYLHTH